MKAFTKGETAILMQQWSDSTVSFRRVEVVSCGVKRMTLKDAATGELLGSNFQALVGFGSIVYSAEWMEENFTKTGRPVHHCFRTGVFKDMQDDAAELMALDFSATFLPYEIADLERMMEDHKARYGENGWYQSTAQKVQGLKNIGPRAKRI